MKFDDLVKRTERKVIEERYFKYSVPQDKEQQLYDFYVLSYLKYLTSLPAKNFRDLNPDLEDTVKDAVNTLYPALREELLRAVFYSVCAEMRHFSVFSENEEMFENSNDPEYKKFDKILKYYLRYRKYHKTGPDEQKELTDVYGVKKPSSRVRTPDSESDNDSDRNSSFKAAQYAIKQAGASPADFIRMAEAAYSKGKWNSSYGGKAWANICKGYLRLNSAEKIESGLAGQNDSKKDDKKDDKKGKDDTEEKRNKSKPEDMGVAIDHVYDLQHNTDTVFNKLKAYYKKGYSWLGKALDYKANVRSYYDLLKHASPLVRQISPPVLYNKLGQTWEQRLNEVNPKQQFTPSSPDTQYDDDGNPIKKPKINFVPFDKNAAHVPASGKINVGDYVVCKNPSGNLIQGDIYYVVDVNTYNAPDIYVDVVDSNGKEVHPNGFMQERFQKVRLKKQPKATSNNAVSGPSKVWRAKDHGEMKLVDATKLAKQVTEDSTFRMNGETYRFNKVHKNNTDTPYIYEYYNTNNVLDDGDFSYIGLTKAIHNGLITAIRFKSDGGSTDGNGMSQEEAKIKANTWDVGTIFSNGYKKWKIIGTQYDGMGNTSSVKVKALDNPNLMVSYGIGDLITGLTSGKFKEEVVKTAADNEEEDNNNSEPAIDPTAPKAGDILVNPKHTKFKHKVMDVFVKDGDTVISTKMLNRQGNVPNNYTGVQNKWNDIKDTYVVMDTNDKSLAEPNITNLLGKDIEDVVEGDIIYKYDYPDLKFEVTHVDHPFDVDQAGVIKVNANQIGNPSNAFDSTIAKLKAGGWEVETPGQSQKKAEHPFKVGDYLAADDLPSTNVYKVTQFLNNETKDIETKYAGTANNAITDPTLLAQQPTYTYPLSFWMGGSGNLTGIPFKVVQPKVRSKKDTISSATALAKKANRAMKKQNQVVNNSPDAYSLDDLAGKVNNVKENKEPWPIGTVFTDSDMLPDHPGYTITGYDHSPTYGNYETYVEYKSNQTDYNFSNGLSEMKDKFKSGQLALVDKSDGPDQPWPIGTVFNSENATESHPGFTVTGYGNGAMHYKNNSIEHPYNQSIAIKSMQAMFDAGTFHIVNKPVKEASQPWTIGTTFKHISDQHNDNAFEVIGYRGDDTIYRHIGNNAGSRHKMNTEQLQNLIKKGIFYQDIKI